MGKKLVIKETNTAQSTEEELIAADLAYVELRSNYLYQQGMLDQIKENSMCYNTYTLLNSKENK